MATRAEQFKAQKQRTAKKTAKPKKAQKKANVTAKSQKPNERKRVKPGSGREITAEVHESTPERRFEKKK